MKKWLERTIDRHWQKSLLMIGLLALISRVIFVLMTTDVGAPTAMDSGTYHRIAVHLLQGKGFSEDGVNPSLFVAPLYPFFLAAVYRVFGIHPLAAELVQCLLALGIGFLTWRIGIEWFGRRPAIIASIQALFIPELFVLCTFLYTEILFIFLFMLALYTAMRLIQRPVLQRIAVAGLCAGLASLTRGVTLLLPAVLLIALLVRVRWREAISTVALYALFLALPILPWMFRNYTTFQAAVPIAVGTGDVFWTGNYLPYDGKYNYEKTMALMDSMTAGMNQVDRDRKLTQAAWQNIKAQPWAAARLMVRKFFRFWFWVYESAPTGQRRGTSPVQWVLMAVYYPLLLLSLAGLWQCRRRWREMLFLYAVLLYYTAIHVIMMVVPRYRFPILPLLCLFAAPVIASWLDRWLHSGHAEAPCS